jgi:NADH-quinone oxidoreductase subunit A
MEDAQFGQYLAVLMLLVLAATATGGMILFSTLLGKRARTSRIKDTAYECGMVPTGSGAARFSVKFYLVAMLFILFDIEVVFLYPWAVVFKPLLKEPQVGAAVFTSMLAFVGILFVGFVYALRKGAFDWGARREP